MIAGSALVHQNIFYFKTKHLCFPQSCDGLRKSSNHPSLTVEQLLKNAYTALLPPFLYGEESFKYKIFLIFCIHGNITQKAELLHT